VNQIRVLLRFFEYARVNHVYIKGKMVPHVLAQSALSKGNKYESVDNLFFRSTFLALLLEFKNTLYNVFEYKLQMHFI
jgi:hypothetical protein